MQNLPIKFPNKKGILVSTPTLLKYMSLFLNKFKLGFGSDTYLPFGPKSRFLLFFFLMSSLRQNRVKEIPRYSLHICCSWSHSKCIHIFWESLYLGSFNPFPHLTWLKIYDPPLDNFCFLKIMKHMFENVHYFMKERKY